MGYSLQSEFQPNSKKQMEISFWKMKIEVNSRFTIVNQPLNVRSVARFSLTVMQYRHMDPPIFHSYQKDCFMQGYLKLHYKPGGKKS